VSREAGDYQGTAQAETEQGRAGTGGTKAEGLKGGEQTQGKGQKAKAASQKAGEAAVPRPGEFTADRIVTVDGERIAEYTVSRNRLQGIDVAGKARVLDFDGTRWLEKGVPVDFVVGEKVPEVTLIPGQGGEPASSKSETRMTIETRSTKSETRGGGAERRVQSPESRIQSSEAGSRTKAEARGERLEARGEEREAERARSDERLARRGKAVGPTELHGGVPNPVVAMARVVAESRFARSRGIEPRTGESRVQSVGTGEDIGTTEGAVAFLGRVLGRGAKEIWAEARGKYSVKAATNRAPLAPGEGREAVEHLLRAIDEATALRPEIKEQYAQERGRRITAYDMEEQALLAAGKLTESAKARLREKYLSGPLFEAGAKPQVTPLYGGLRPAELPAILTPKDYNALHRMIREHPGFDAWDYLSVGKSLDRLLSGDIPGDKALADLRLVFGDKVVNGIVQKKPFTTRLWREMISAANVPRTLMSMLDMSAVLRQAAVSTVAHPFAASKALARSFHFVFSPKDFETYFREVLPADEYYPQMRRSRLAITDPTSGNLSQREEAFLALHLNKVPGLGHVIRASERAYVGYLTKLRVDLFRDWVDALRSNNEINIHAEPGTRDAKAMEAMAEVINTLTGRGELGERLGDWKTPANVLFFSPRLILSRVQTLNPQWYASLLLKNHTGSLRDGTFRIDPVSRRIATRAMVDVAKFVGVGMTVLWLAKQNGAEVELDPRSTDFGKIKVGNTRIDIWGGHQQYVRAFFQFASGRVKQASGRTMTLGQGYKARTRYDVFMDFASGKASPPVSLALDWAKGRDFQGRPFSIGRELLDRAYPLYLQDVKDAWQDAGLGRAALVAGTGFWGVGASTYKPRAGGFGLRLR
jgi:hypothetical protein